MINSPDELQSLLGGSVLAGTKVISVPVLDTDETALALNLSPDQIEDGWKAVRRLLEQTKRWPLVTTVWGGSGKSFEGTLAEADIFSRFYFEEAPDHDDVSPRGILAKSANVDVVAFLQKLDAALAEEPDEDYIEEELQFCEANFGRRPTEDDLPGGIENKLHQIDRWIFEQTIAKGELPAPEEGRFPWFDPENAVLLLLPTMSGWESLAYVNFYGAYHGSEYYIALGKRWEERFGAELMANYGTMLQCYVDRPPTDPLVAWELAREHDLFAPCNLALPCLDVRQYASGLLNHDRWFLHERP